MEQDSGFCVEGGVHVCLISVAGVIPVAVGNTLDVRVLLDEFLAFVFQTKHTAQPTGIFFRERVLCISPFQTESKRNKTERNKQYGGNLKKKSNPKKNYLL